MQGQYTNNPSDRADASSFLSAMNQLNQQHPPDRISRPIYRPLVPTTPTPPAVQTFGMTDLPTSAGLTAQPLMPQESVTLSTFRHNFQVQFAALLAMPEAERREKNRLITSARVVDFHRLLQQREILIKMRPSLRPEAFAKHSAELQGAIRFSYGVYARHLCLTFRINDLPVELLMAIFRLSVWPLGNWEADVRASIRVTHVCRLWRSIAIADKGLWSPVCFIDPKTFERSFAVLERSGTTGLDIRIRDIDDQPMSKEEMTELIDRLFKKLPSIRKLDIFLYSREAVIPILEALLRVAQEAPTMELEHFEIHSYYASGEFLPSLPLFGGSIPPSFRHLRLNGVNIQWDVALLSRLTTLDLRRLAMPLLPSSAVFRAMLAGATGLEKMILDGAGPRYEPSAPLLPPVALPSLRILVLGGLSDPYAEYVLSHFNAPNVLDFTIMFPIDNVYSKFITALTTTSRMPRIKILILVRIPLRGKSISKSLKLVLGRWLESMPELTFLRVLQTSREIFDVLRLKPPIAQRSSKGRRNAQAPEQSRPICPQVVYVDFQNEVEDIDHFFSYIAHRRTLGYPLKKVWLAQATINGLTSEQRVKLGQALGGICTVQVADHRTVEEEAMCKQV